MLFGLIMKCDIRMLQLQPFSPNRKIAIAEGKQLLLIQKEISFVVNGPLKFLGHGKRVNRAGLHTYAVEQPVAHQRMDLKGNKSELP